MLLLSTFTEYLAISAQSSTKQQPGSSNTNTPPSRSMVGSTMCIPQATVQCELLLCCWLQWHWLFFSICSLFPDAHGQAGFSFKLQTPLWPHSLVSACLTVPHLLHSYVDLILCCLESKCQQLIVFSLWTLWALCSLRSNQSLCSEPTEICTWCRAKNHHPLPTPQLALIARGQWIFIYPLDRKWCNVRGQAHSL